MAVNAALPGGVRIYTAWRGPSIYPAWRKPSIYPAWRAPNPEPCTERIPSPACGGRGSHEKNARIFFMGTREGGRRPEGGNTKPGFIPLGTNPVFTPLGGSRRNSSSTERHHPICRIQRLAAVCNHNLGDIADTPNFSYIQVNKVV